MKWMVVWWLHEDRDDSHRNEDMRKSRVWSASSTRPHRMFGCRMSERGQTLHSDTLLRWPEERQLLGGSPHPVKWAQRRWRLLASELSVKTKVIVSVRLHVWLVIQCNNQCGKLLACVHSNMKTQNQVLQNPSSRCQWFLAARQMCSALMMRGLLDQHWWIH